MRPMSALKIVRSLIVSAKSTDDCTRISAILSPSPVCYRHLTSTLSPINKYVKAKLELEYPNSNPNPDPGSRWVAFGLQRANALG